MRIAIDKRPEYDMSFMRYLLGITTRMYLRVLNPRKLKSYADFINENICPMNSLLLCKLITKYVLSIRVVEYKFHYEFIPSSRLRYGSVPLSVLFNLVEFGNLYVKGTFLMSRVSHHIKTKQKLYYKKYLFLYY